MLKTIILTVSQTIIYFILVRKSIKTETRNVLLSDLIVESTTIENPDSPQKAGWFSSWFRKSK